MAYAAVASLSQTIDIVLSYHQHSISPQLKDLTMPLQKHTLSLQTFFEDFPHKTYIWEEIIREATEMAERIIELLLSDSLLKLTDRSSSESEVEKGRYQLPYGITELQRVTTEIESIVGEIKGESRSEAMDDPDELMDIVYLLRGGSSSLRRIAIFGEGGVGKTTLARNAYNNPLIVDHFEVRVWSTVSSEYDLPRFIRELLRSMGAEPESVSSNTEDELIQSLYETLHGKRYLIVVDAVREYDVWNWLENTKMLPDEENGSRILSTTTVFSSVKFVHDFYRMSFMNEDEAWNMLQQEIFKGDNCPSKLEPVGKMIAASFRWRSAAIKVISGILAANQTEAAWEDVLENINIASENGNVYDSKLSRMLTLSYTYLPHHLRPCFLYLGIWPQNEHIKVSKIIKLWVAEGILDESGSKSLEETGEEHVEDLVRRGLVSVVDQKKCNGRIRSIRIHDLIRDVCLRQARVDSFILHVGRFHRFDDRRALATELESCRCVSTLTYGDEVLEAIYGSTIRTIILQLDVKGEVGTRLPIGNVRLLRILDLSNAYHYDLPTEVFKLFHLRYLAFCGFSISKAISNLENLQTLIIIPRRMCGEVGKLPEGIWRMPQLRHISVVGFMLPNQEGAMSALEDMQTLRGVLDFTCSIENLRMIPNLKKLTLFYSNKLRDVVQDYELHNLIHLQQLKTLKIQMHSFPKKQNVIDFAFPPTLNMLELCGLHLRREDMEIVASLPNLQVLKLKRHSFMGETWETSEGGFSQLNYLLIEDSNMKKWTTKSSHFPKLKSLVLRLCSHLFELPEDLGKIPTLELIEMDDYNDYLWCSAKRIQKYQRSLGDEHFRILLHKGSLLM